MNGELIEKARRNVITHGVLNNPIESVKLNSIINGKGIAPYKKAGQLIEQRFGLLFSDVDITVFSDNQ